MTTKCDISIYDILPDLDSYLTDVEENLKMNNDYEDYLKDPSGVIRDVILDFGNWADRDPFSMYDGIELVDAIIRDYVHPCG